MSYVFDPEVIAEVVREALERPGSLEDRIVRVQAGLAARYPGAISPSGEWHLCTAGGGTQQLTILHASLTEYVTIVGIPLMTSGFSGRYRTEIYDYILDGELENYAPGDRRATVYREGDVSIFAPREGRNYAVRDRLWMVEYARGSISGMFALPLADTMFGTLDFTSLARLAWTFNASMLRRIVRGHVWKNWMGNLRCTPALVFRPTGVEELSAIVRQARAAGRKVRLFGSKHAWSALAPTDDYMVDTSLMKRCLAVDAGARTVRVEAGMTVGELTEAAAASGLTVTSPTVATSFTVGGLVATASHGTGLGAATFADNVVGFTVVRHDGEIVEVGPDRADDMAALRCSLGALGILYAVTIQCIPATNFHVQNVVVPLDEAIDRIPEVIRAHHAVELFWFPCTKKATFRTIDPTDAPVTYTGLHKLASQVRQYALEGFAGSIGVFAVTRLVPTRTPWLTWLGSFAMHRCDWVMSPKDAYHYQYFYPKVEDAEFAIPLERSCEAFRAYVDLVDRFEAERRYPINMLVHARFTRGDQTWLSPDFERDSCYIESVTAKGTKDAEELYRAAEAMLMDRFDGRPHWAKIWYDMAGVRRSYEANLRRFEVVRRRWDPDGVFLNDFLAQLFAPFDARPSKPPTPPGPAPRPPSW